MFCFLELHRYYNDEERATGYKKKDFKVAKFDFVDEMLAWSGAGNHASSIMHCRTGCGGHMHACNRDPCHV